MEPIHLRDYVSGKSLVRNQDKIALAREINGKVSELVLEGENGDLEAVRVHGAFANLADKLDVKLKAIRDTEEIKIPEGYLARTGRREGERTYKSGLISPASPLTC